MIRSEMMTVEASAGDTLPALVDRAARALAGARTSAEILEAREMAGLAYDAAKRAARLAKAKGAHDALVAAAHRAQADALLIESNAKRRLADEYDAAQERGEVARHGGSSKLSVGELPTTHDLGITHSQIQRARRLRDAEEIEPGITERALNEALQRGDEPTRGVINRAVVSVVMTPSEALTAKAQREEREEADQQNFRAFRKLWKAMSRECRAMVRDYIAKD
jgi:hypothetical protein